MFGLSFLTILNIYKDYFKGRKRLRTVAQEYNCTIVKKSVTGNLICPSSSFSSRSCYVLYTVGFSTKQLHDLHRVMNRRTLQPTSFSSWWLSRVLGSAQLVSHVLGAVHWKRDYHYKTNPIGYWGKGSTIGWYKVYGFLYL